MTITRLRRVGYVVYLSYFKKTSHIDLLYMLCYLCASSWRARMWYELLMSQFEFSDICLIFFSWIKYCIISCCEYLIFMYLVCPSLTSLFIWYSWYLHHRQPCVVFTPPPTMSDIYTNTMCSGLVDTIFSTQQTLRMILTPFHWFFILPGAGHMYHRGMSLNFTRNLKEA